MELISHVDLVHGNESSTMISKTCRAVVRMGNGCMVIMMIQNPHIMSVAIFPAHHRPLGAFYFSPTAAHRPLPKSWFEKRREKRERGEGREKPGGYIARRRRGPQSFEALKLVWMGGRQKIESAQKTVVCGKKWQQT